MSNKKKTLKRLLILIFTGCIFCNLNVLYDIGTNTYYNDLEWKNISGKYAVAEFDNIEKIENAPFDAYYYVGYLTNGRRVILCYYRNTEVLELNTLSKGMFLEVPEDKEYLVDEYQTEDLMFWYMGDNYFHTGGLSYIVFSIGITGIAFSILIFILKNFNINLKEVLISCKQDGIGAAAERESGFELLRIVCIIMIIMQHFGYWGDFCIEEMPLSSNIILLQTIVNAGKIGVNCFMLITGYFMVKSKFKISRVFRLAAEVWFYSWGFGIIFMLWNRKLFDMKSFSNTVLPVFSGQYWFITIYLIVYILSPFLNAAAWNVERNTYKGLLFFLYMIWSVIPSFIAPGWDFTNTGWMVLMYMTGAYIRLYGSENVKKNWLFLGGCLISYVILMLCTVLADINGTMVVYNQNIAQKHNLFIAVCSLLLFLFFKNFKMGYNRMVNEFAACSFGVYLIHENVMVKKFLWTDWVRSNQYFDKGFYVLYAAGAIVFVYFVCVLIEWLRQRAAAYVRGIC